MKHPDRPKRKRSKASRRAKPSDGTMPQTACGKPCDHGSPCMFVAGHDPDIGHETKHGCVFYDPHWTVNHHLPGGRYGKITIRFDDASVAHMVADNDANLALAKRIVDLLNRKGLR